MPLRWIICPISCCNMEIPDCLHCAEEELLQPVYDRQTQCYTGEERHCVYYYPFLKRVADQAAGRRLAGTSATMLTGCHRQAWLQQRIDFAVDPKEQVAAADGTAWHDWLEDQNEPSVYAEVRIAVTLPSGRVITGKMDRLKRVPACWQKLHTGEQEFWYDDHKRKADEVFDRAPDYYAWQLNIYAAMLFLGGEVIESDVRGYLRARDGQMPGDWLQGSVTRLRLLPSSHLELGAWVDVPLFPVQLVIEYLEECVKRFGEATLFAPPAPKYDAAHSSFCERFCPVMSECLQYGGTPDDLMKTFTERLFFEEGIDVRWRRGQRH